MKNPRKRSAVDAQAASIAAHFPRGIARPALRALYAAGLKTLSDLGRITETEISALHGMGPKALAELRSAMAERGISFRER
jgi:hypothetical protein